MAIYSSWIHGNALRIETPFSYNVQGEQNGQLVLTPLGWGANVVSSGHAVVSWMHLPIPTIKEPVSFFERFELVRVFLLFECSEAFVTDVHIYDGNVKIAEFANRSLQGSFLSKGVVNTFVLDKPHMLKSGLGLSFLFKTAIGTGGMNEHIPQGTLVVAAAGAEYETRNIIFSAVGRIFSK